MVTQESVNTPKSLLKTIQDLEESSASSPNSLADLLHLLSTTADPHTLLKATFALYRSFIVVYQSPWFSSISSEDAEKSVVSTWVREKLDSFADMLCGFLQDEDKTLRASSLKILFSLLRHVSNGRGDPGISSANSTRDFNAAFFKRIVLALLVCPPSSRLQQSDSGEISKSTKMWMIEGDVRDAFVDDWLAIHADIRWYFLRDAGSSLAQGPLITSNPQIPSNALAILEKFHAMPTSPDMGKFFVEPLHIQLLQTDPGLEADKFDADESDWRTYFDDSENAGEKKTKTPGDRRRVYAMTVPQQLHSLAAHRAVFTKCWLTLLPHLSSTAKTRLDNDDSSEESLSLVSRALVVLHRSVLPHLTKAIMIMDWVAGCVDYGGSVGLLALNALFVLMRDQNLDYPQFYTRLYAFLDRDLLHLKHRARLFRLTEQFLASSHLPATLLASFIKRMSRLSLSAPPAAIVMIIPFTYNILKRHPALMSMIHRESVKEGHVDPYDPNETNPLHTSAIHSSLWELYSLKNHYHPSVSTLVKVFEEVFTKPQYSTEDFLDHTYETLFKTEVLRKVTKDPAANNLSTNSIISHLDCQALDMVCQIWTLPHLSVQAPL